MTTASSIVTATIARFDETLNQRGFRQVGTPSPLPDGWRWSGTVGAQSAEVSLTAGFPFDAPKVFLPGKTEISWHREPDGSLCLWTEADRAGLPWLDPDRLLGKIESWIQKDQTGWTGEPPALDLEAYFPRDQNRLVLLVGESAEYVDKWLACVPDRSVPGRFSIERAVESLGDLRKLPKTSEIAFCIDIGEQVQPVSGWDSLVSYVPAAKTDDITHAVTMRGRVLLLVRYSIGGLESQMTLSMRSGTPQGSIRLSAVTTADETSRELSLRRGPLRDQVRTATVAVIGLGAVGSFIADNLARAGVGTLILRDGQMLLPGNLIRHLCDAPLVGLAKTTAVRLTIDRHRPRDAGEYSEGGSLTSLEDGVELLSSTDLVVDATADGAVAHLLLEATKLTGRRFLSVAVEGHGQYARADVIPTPVGQEPLQSDGVEEVELLVGAGCGDPVSPTSPSAVIETASIGARLALAMLTGADVGVGERRRLSMNS